MHEGGGLLPIIQNMICHSGSYSSSSKAKLHFSTLPFMFRVIYQSNIQPLLFKGIN